MIEYIKGKIDEITPTYAVIETQGGVGYMLNEIRNMSQWWNRNKIGLESQRSGK